MTTWLRRLWQTVNTPPIDAVSPPDPPEWERELSRHRGLSAIMSASRDNVINLAERRKQLTACCESSPFRKSVQ